MLILLKITFHRSYMKCSHWLFLRVVSQVIEDFFSSFMRIQNVLKLACNISDGKKKIIAGEESCSFNRAAGRPSPALGTRQEHVRGAGPAWGGGRAVCGLCHTGPTLSKALHSEGPILALMLCCHRPEILNTF